MSGINQALWDIAGKAAGLPVFKLLGGRVRERVRCYIRSGPEFYGVELEDAARRARELGSTPSSTASAASPGRSTRSARRRWRWPRCSGCGRFSATRRR